MDVEVTVSNYRCFPDTPVRFALKKGLQAFVGVNNSGKSSLLRLFYELRQIFLLMSDQGALVKSLGGNQGFALMPLVKDPDEIFYDRNERDLVIGFEMNIAQVDNVPMPTRYEIVIPRGTNHWSS